MAVPQKVTVQGKNATRGCWGDNVRLGN